MQLDRVSFHGSHLSGIRGATSLRGATIASDQVIELAHAALSALGVIVNDDDPTAALLVGQDVP